MSLLAVNHHYYREKALGRGIYPITSVDLRERVLYLSRFFKIVGEKEILQELEGAPHTTDLCVLTFDDGLKEQLQALHLLESMGMSAIFFVPALPLTKRVVLDVHKLHLIRSRKTDEELALLLDQSFGFSAVDWDYTLLSTQYRYDSDDSRKVKYFFNFILDSETRQQWIDSTFESLFGSEQIAAEQLYMDHQEVRMLAQRGMLGSHAFNHLPLAGLSSYEIVEEIEGALEVLEKVGGCRVRGISYPFGGKSAVSEEVFSIAARCGLLYGFTMERGTNDADDMKSPLQLKRIDTNDVPLLVL